MLNKISQWIVRKLEDFFSWYGRQVATYPLPAILVCLVITGLAAVGLMRYKTENNAFKLWIPDNSDFVEDYGWLEKNSPPEIRFNSLIVTSSSSPGNILTPTALAYIASLHRRVSTNTTWPQVCYQLPVSNSPPDMSLPPDCSLDQPFWVEPCYPSSWCSMVQAATHTECFEKSLLELWGYLEPGEVASLTEQEILDVINQEHPVSKVFGTPVNVSDYLGEVTYNSSGHIVSAEATFIQWYGKINASAVTGDDVSNMGTGEIVDQASLDFEEVLRDLLMDDRDSLPEIYPGLVTFINVARAYSDIAGETIVNDAIMMPVGFMIVFVYVTFMLGKFNCVEQRAILALCGLAAIGLTIGFTYGFCSGLGLFYGPMHNIIPFLLLGIGIDDMFVIMQCYDNLSPQDKGEDDVVHTISLTMRRAGVAITVTSLTDFMVFAIGSTTVLPALRSFCLWCGVGILAVYFYQATLFTACLALDCRRLAANRNGLCPCFTHKAGSKKGKEGSLAQQAFGVLGRLITSTLGMVTVLLLAGGLLAGGIWGTCLLQQKFDPTWFLPTSSYLRQWFSANSRYFPSEGERVTVYMTEMDWPMELEKVEQLVNNFTQAEDIIVSVDSWYPSFKEFSNTWLDDDVPDPMDDQTFHSHLTQYLFNADPTISGLRYQPSFKYEDGQELVCGEDAPSILLSTFDFKHAKFEGRSEHIPALNRVKDMISSCQFSGNVFALTQEYSNWETDEVITLELTRNLAIALACVFLTTLLLLANLLGSILVLICVAVTLVDLCGYMHFWGLTIDVVSAVNIIIAIGLCVDYSVHICHAFLTITSGTRRERAAAALVEMGPAVLNGGLSTLIAFILLAGSDSHVFSSFFKIFLLVVLIGVWHGLVLLPVLLALVGPAPYSSSESLESGRDHKEEEISRKESGRSQKSS